MDKQFILSEIRRLEAQKARDPEAASYLNAEITSLCDKLKQPNAFKPRQVV